MVRYLGNAYRNINASSSSNANNRIAGNPHWRADRADFPASQNSHCCYSAAFSIMERNAQALNQGLLESIDAGKLRLRVEAARQHLAAPDNALLDAEYAAARADSYWPEHWYWLRSNWRWLAAEAAIYAGALTVLSMPVWAGAAGKALLAAVDSIDWTQLGAAASKLGTDYIRALDSILAK